MTLPIAIYIDDREEEAKGYIRRLNEVGSLQVGYLLPPKDLSLEEIAGNTQLFFVDWELDTAVDYMGLTFAARLREVFNDFPIVLITSEDIFNKNELRRYAESLLFDAYISKQEITSDPAGVVRQCLHLINGFAGLRASNKSWLDLLKVLQANEEEEKILGDAAPPLQKSASWRVAEMAQWIQRVLLKYPGILYNPLYAATFLGITEEEFRAADVQSLFEDAQYKGVFSPPEGRWWRDRLRAIAQALMSEAGIEDSSVNRNFAAAFARIRKRDLDLAECIVSREKPADWVCYVLNQPVRIEYSLVYHPDSRPSIMEDARVSFKAIRESDEVLDEYFDPSNRQLVEAIRSASSDGF